MKLWSIPLLCAKNNIKKKNTENWFCFAQACMEFQFYKEITALPTTTPTLPVQPASSAPLSSGGATETLVSIATTAAGLLGQQQGQQIPLQQHSNHGHHMVILIFLALSCLGKIWVAKNLHFLYLSHFSKLLNWLLYHRAAKPDPSVDWPIKCMSRDGA